MPPQLDSRRWLPSSPGSASDPKVQGLASNWSLSLASPLGPPPDLCPVAEPPDWSALSRRRRIGSSRSPSIPALAPVCISQQKAQP